jgi:hypothetical protein
MLGGNRKWCRSSPGKAGSSAADVREETAVQFQTSPNDQSRKRASELLSASEIGSEA